MTPVSINYLAVLVAAVVPMVLGGLWYSPLLFAKKFMALVGKTQEELKKHFNPARDYGLSFLTALVMSYILAHFVSYTRATTIGSGMQTGFWLWLGFVVTTNSSTVIFEGRKSGLYWINMGYNFVCLLVMGAILAVWT